MRVKGTMGTQQANIAATDAAVRGAQSGRVARDSWRWTRAHWRDLVKYVVPAAIMIFLLWTGCLYQLRSKYGIAGDVFRYQCFAVTFWAGPAGEKQAFPTQCDKIDATYAGERVNFTASHLPQPVKQWMLDHSATDQAFHTLPVEYPILTLIPFSIPLLMPFLRYTIAFGVEMSVLALLMYALLIRLKGWKTGAFFALFYGAAAYGTGIARFDLIPAALTLLALICVERRRWVPAYLLIVAATFLKYYPVVLFLPLVIYHWQSAAPGERLRALAKPLGVSAAVSAVLVGLSLAINPLIAYFQVSSLSHRPLEVESLGASIVYLGQYIGRYDFERVVSYGSDNLISPLAAPAATMLTVLMVVGLAVFIFQLWRRKLSVQQAWLALLLIVVITGKIFSTQYLIWVLPVMAYVTTTEGIKPMLWLLVCSLTSLGYPGLFGQPILGFYRVVLIRNACLVALTIVALFPDLWPDPVVETARRGASLDVPTAPGGDAVADASRAGVPEMASVSSS